MSLTFEAWAGTLGSLPGTPDRPAGSLRRTTSVQTVWSGRVDLASDVTMLARGQDVLTAPDGAGVVIDTASVELSAQGAGHEVSAIAAEPRIPQLDAAIGASLMGGFRKAVAATLSDVGGSVLGLLLDDLPAAMIVAASVPIRVGIEVTGVVPEWFTRPGPLSPYTCLGHRAGGGMEQRRIAGAPLLGQGPPAGDLRRPDDPLAWTEAPPMPAHSTRRLRRIDVSVGGDELVIDTHFRDSYMNGSDVETSVHEYEVAVTAGSDDLRVRSVEVRPRVLPGPECPGAAASAQRIVGQRLSELRRFVRAELRGETVCPHLNDQLRAVTDVPQMVELLP